MAVKGKSRAVALYEVLDALPETVREARIRSRAAFDAAQARYEAGDIAGALAGWRALDADDPVAWGLAAASLAVETIETVPETLGLAALLARV